MTHFGKHTNFRTKTKRFIRDAGRNEQESGREAGKEQELLETDTNEGKK